LQFWQYLPNWLIFPQSGQIDVLTFSMLLMQSEQTKCSAGFPQSTHRFGKISPEKS